jgi:hypothetical protein
MKPKERYECTIAFMLRERSIGLMIPFRRCWRYVALGTMALAMGVHAQGPEQKVKFTILHSTLSPDQRYGVSVPIYEGELTPDWVFQPGQDKLVEVRTGRILAALLGETSFNRALGHSDVGWSRWSADGSILRWKVDGKWTPHALVLLKIEKDKVKWQLDLLTTAQQAILQRTRAAVPERYLAGKEANRGSGSAFPDGFTVNVTTEGDYDFVDHKWNGTEGEDEAGPLSLPLRVRADLCCNLKWNDDVPDLDSTLYGVVDTGGKFTVTGFHILPHRRAFGWPWHGLNP